MIIRTPTRTKTKSFKGEQMDFKFPSNNSSELKTHDEAELNNHFLVNESLRNEKNQIDEEKDLTTPPISNNLPQSYDSKHENLNVDLSKGYYSFANISDNTTSPIFFHGKRDPETDNDVVSMLNINNNSKFSRFEGLQTLVHQKNVGDLSLVESTTTPISTSSFSSSPQNCSLSPHIENLSTKSSKAINTIPTDIPTANNLSYDIVPSSSLSSLNSRQLDSQSLPFSPSSSRYSSKGEQTPINLYRKPTIRQVDSMEYFSANSRISSSNNSNQNKYHKNNSYYGNGKSESQSNLKNIKNSNNMDNKINNKTVRRMSSMRDHPKSTLKRSKAIRCHGGLLKYFEIIGVKIKKLLKHIRLLLFKKRTVNNYHSKNFNSRRSCSSFSSINKRQALLTTTKGSKKLRKKNNTNHKKINNKKSHNYQVSNSSSLQALQPVLIEKAKQTTINGKQSLEIKKSNKNINATDIESINNKSNDNTNMKSSTDNIINSLVKNCSNTTTGTYNNDSVFSCVENEDLMMTKTTLRRTNASIRRDASINTISTSSTSTYYSAVTHQENGSPVRKSKLTKSVASNSLNSLVRQPSVVVKNKVSPLHKSSQYSMNEINDSDMKHKMDDKISNKSGRSLKRDDILDKFDVNKEEEKKRLSSDIIDSDPDSPIFTKLDTTIENIADSIKIDTESSLEAKNEKAQEEEKEIEKKETKTVFIVDNKRADDLEKKAKEEKVRKLMKTYLSQIIQKRILMRLQLVKLQESNVIEPECKQRTDHVLNEHKTGCHANSIVINKSRNESENNTSSSLPSSEQCNENNLNKFNQLHTITGIDAHNIDANKENNCISLQDPSKDVLFGVNTLIGPSHEMVLTVPTTTIKRSMTLPIGMKV